MSRQKEAARVTVDRGEISLKTDNPMRVAESNISSRHRALRGRVRRFFGFAFTLLLLLEMSGLPHFIATSLNGKVADCTSPDSTTGRCLPFCPTCACTHLGRSVTISVHVPPRTPPQPVVASLVPIDLACNDSPQPNEV